MDKIILKIIP